MHPHVPPAPAPVTVVYVRRGGGAGWHSRGCPRCRDPHVFGEASRAANGPALQLGAIKPDRCGAGGTGRGTFPTQFDTDVGRAQELPRGWGRAAGEPPHPPGRLGCWGVSPHWSGQHRPGR